MNLPVKIKVDVASTDQIINMEVASIGGAVAMRMATPIIAGSGGGGSYIWGTGLRYDNATNTVSVDVVDDAISGESRPISSNGVYKEIGNVAILLGLI